MFDVGKNDVQDDNKDDDDDDDDDDDEENDDDEANEIAKSPIKSASYMDELRQRLERVLNESSAQNPPSTQSSSSSLTQVKQQPISRRPTLIPPPTKLKPTNIQSLDPIEPSKSKKVNQIKSPVITASTPLPRKQIKAYGNLSYRTIDTINYQQQQPPMSKSFSISTKREGKHCLKESFSLYLLFSIQNIEALVLCQSHRSRSHSVSMIRTFRLLHQLF